MKILFENWRKFINEERSFVQSEYEKLYPSAVLPAVEKNKIQKTILLKFKKTQKDMIRSLRRGRKRKQYIKKFGASGYKKALPLILKNIKNSQIKIVLGWDSPVVPNDQKEEFFGMLLNKGRRMAGALVKEAPGGHIIIILADLLIKRGALDSYLETTFYHEFIGHIAPETFEKVTGKNVSKEQSLDIKKIIKSECLRMATKQAHVSAQGLDPEIGAMKEINAWISAMAAKGFSRKDYNAICKDQTQARNLRRFQKTASFKKYGSGAWCIKCNAGSSEEIIRVIDNLAKAAPVDNTETA